MIDFIQEPEVSGYYFSEEGGTAASDTETTVLPYMLTKGQRAELIFSEYEEIK